jgi:hypothetical protein
MVPEWLARSAQSTFPHQLRLLNPKKSAPLTFLGEMVTGYSGIGTKLSTSRQLYQCAAETAFKSI